MIISNTVRFLLGVIIGYYILGNMYLNRRKKALLVEGGAREKEDLEK